MNIIMYYTLALRIYRPDAAASHSFNDIYSIRNYLLFFIIMVIIIIIIIILSFDCADLIYIYTFSYDNI